MIDEELIEALRSHTKKVLSKNWLAGRECPECGSEADRPKCMWDFGPNCPRLDPDNYSPPAWEYVPDKDCATAADRLKALTAENEQLRDVAMDAHDALIFARAFILKKHGTKNPHRDETIEKLRTLLGDPPNDLAALEKQP
jgi:hypothetical protein